MRDYAELVKALREGAEWAEKLCAHETAKRQSEAADAIEELLAEMVTLRNQLPQQTIETNLYDIEEIHPDCTVQILKNSITGEVSVGWWENDNKPIETKEGK